MGDMEGMMEVAAVRQAMGASREDSTIKASFTDDFICISEFSEIVGPVPLFCIPPEGKGSFNIEKFVIRIMAVDYQNKSCDPGAFVDDTQVVISEPTESAYAYVHHFTLLDVFARGYVRPICMSYITRHPTKIMDNFAKLMKKFNKVSRIFKAGNQLVFLEDLKHRLADLYHTREMLQQKKTGAISAQPSSTPPGSTDGEGDAQEGTLTSTESAKEGDLPRKESNLNLEPLMVASPSSTTVSVSAAEGESVSTPPVPRASESINIAGSNQADQDQEYDPTSCSFIPPTPTIVNETIKEMESIRRRFHHNILKTQNDSGRCKTRLTSMDDTSVREYSHDKFETEDEDDEDDIFMEADYSIGGLHGDESVHEQPDMTSETDRNPDDEDEAGEGDDGYEDSKCSDDEHSDLRNEERILASLYQKLGMSLPESDYKPQVLKTLYKGRRYDTKLRELTELCGKAYQKAIDKLNKIHTHYSRPSIVLELEDEENGYAEPSSSLLTFGRNIVCNFNLEAYTRSPHKRSSARDTPLSSFSSPYATRRGSNSSPTQSKDVGESTSEASSGSSSYDSPAQLTPPTDQPLISPEPFDEAILTRKLMGLDGTNVAPHVLVVPPERSGTPPLLASSTPDRKKEPKVKSNLETFASILWDCSVSNAGKGITKLIRYAFVRHLVFSLLKGRPVIIYGTPQNENAVRELVTACSLFVPGSGRGANALISHWRTKPIHMSDLAYLKLIGLSKRVTIPKAVERYVSIFDYENAQLRCPPYTKGKLIEKILGLRTHWPDEKTHLAYIHYKLLEAATQACLYYQICCVANNHAYPPIASAVQSASRSTLYQTVSADIAVRGGVKGGKVDTNSRGGDSGRPGASGRGTGAEERGKEDAGEVKRTSTMNAYPYPTNAAPGAPATGDAGKPSPIARRSYHSEGQIPTINAPSVPNSAREQTKNAFFKQIKAKPHDMAVIEYFAEVVKEQQSLEMHGPGAQVAPVIHLDYTPCALFKNVKEKGKGNK